MTALLADALGRGLGDLRLSVIDACNFRCPYCMPEDRIPHDHGTDASTRLSFDAIETLVRGFARVGTRKLRITGGEPLLRRGLASLIARLAQVESIEDIALTTNGSLLARHAAELRDAGLHRITVSLDALDADRFHAMSGGRGRIESVLRGIDAAARAGFAPLKINCVVQRAVNEDQVLPLAAFAREGGHVLRLIEYMDVGTCNAWSMGDVVSAAQLRDAIHARWPLHPLPARQRSDVATRFAYDDGAGEVGFIASVTEPFCGDCSRARVSADGHLYTCLFAGYGVDMRTAIAHGEQAVAQAVSEVWSRRVDRYSELRDAAHPQRRAIEMYVVGG